VDKPNVTKDSKSKGAIGNLQVISFCNSSDQGEMAIAAQGALQKMVLV